jgi:hypothetical protein
MLDDTFNVLEEGEPLLEFDINELDRLEVAHTRSPFGTWMIT